MLYRWHRTRIRNQLVSLWGAPSLVYKGGEEGGRPASWCPPQGGIPTPTRSRFPPFPSPNRRRKEGEEERKERGADPPPNSDWDWGGGRPQIGLLLLSPTKAQ